MKSIARYVAVALLLTAGSVPAQDQPKRPERDRPDRPSPEAQRPDRPPVERPGERRPEGGPRPEPLNLNDEQREVWRNAMESHREDMMQLGEKMRDARRALQEAMFAEKQNSEKVKSAAKEVAELQAEMTVIQAKAFAALRPKLTGEQVERLKNMPPEFLMRAVGGPGGPGGPDFRAPGTPRDPNFKPGDEPRRPRGDAPENPPRESRRPRPESEPK